MKRKFSIIDGFFRKKKSQSKELVVDEKKLEKPSLNPAPNINHEISTLFTLINGPCEQILSHEGSDDYVKKYTSLVLKNSNRLNKLIHELIEPKGINPEPSAPEIREGLSETSEIDFETKDDRTLVFNIKKNESIKDKATILIIDDDPEILWFIFDVFSELYNVITLDNSEKVFSTLEQTQVDLIVSDVMMPGLDGLSLTKEIKKNKKTSHIPLIILSAKKTPEDHVEGMEAGAEIYITKPFNVNYIKSVVERLIQRQNELKEYYNSALSAFNISEGQLVHKEDKIFFENMIEIIEKNISNSDFSIETLASELHVSTRKLYRKLSLATNQTPGDLLKEYRLAFAEKLLVTTKFSIDEIIYKTGYSNRGNFYKIFSNKYGMTPKAYREKKTDEL